MFSFTLRCFMAVCCSTQKNQFTSFHSRSISSRILLLLPRRLGSNHTIMLIIMQILMITILFVLLFILCWYFYFLQGRAEATYKIGTITRHGTPCPHSTGCHHHGYIPFDSRYFHRTDCSFLVCETRKMHHERKRRQSSFRQKIQPDHDCVQG